MGLATMYAARMLLEREREREAADDKGGGLLAFCAACGAMTAQEACWRTGTMRPDCQHRLIG